ncbi:hypothetical protein, partial [Pseudonocardia sp.]|uniref:hypothetical protein n=1 Tax=Pseudonocardia sp. TaxID=60912 RepID=UPI0031FC585F
MTNCVASATHGGPTCPPDNHGLAGQRDRRRRRALLTSINALATTHPGQVSAAFQTYGPGTGNDCTAIAIVVTHHCGSVELWPAAPHSHCPRSFRGTPR